MCEKCFRKSDLFYEDAELTDAHKGRLCCWCTKFVKVFALIVHRHPEAVKCKGVHA